MYFKKGVKLTAPIFFHPNVSLSFSPGNIGKLLGPLPMHPAAEDNYGYDACAILCLPCVPNILVIATESGMLYHCVVLEGEEEDDQTVSQPSVCVHLYRRHLVYILYQHKCLDEEFHLLPDTSIYFRN